MANKKKQKYPSKSKVLADARRYVIKTGEYNGASDSSDFYVSGHSTGATNTEMDELSRQVTRDAGGYDYQEPEFANDQGETGYEMYQGEGIGDVGGPELYGNAYAPKKTSTSRGLAIGAAVGLAATALLGGLAYMFYQSESKPARRVAQKPGRQQVGRTQGKKSASAAASKKASPRAKKSSRAAQARA